jgi:MFS family permease
VASGVVANLVSGTLFGWSLVARQATRDVGGPAPTAAAAFAAAIAVFTLAVLGVRHGLPVRGPRRLLAGAAVAAGAGLAVVATGQHPLALWCGIGLLFGAASGVGYGVSLALTARVPAPHRGAATGLVVAAYAAGPVILGILAPHALPLLGWRMCAAGLALAVTGLLAGAATLAPADRTSWWGPAGVEEPVDRRTVVPLWILFACGAAPGRQATTRPAGGRHGGSVFGRA